MTDLIQEIEKAIRRESRKYNDDTLIAYRDGASLILPLLKKAIEIHMDYARHCTCSDSSVSEYDKLTIELLKLLGSET